MLGRLCLIFEEEKSTNGHRKDVQLSLVVRRGEREREYGLCCEVEVDDKLLAGEERGWRTAR